MTEFFAIKEERLIAIFAELEYISSIVYLMFSLYIGLEQVAFTGPSLLPESNNYTDILLAPDASHQKHIDMYTGGRQQ